jgi:hypothetical protein
LILLAGSTPDVVIAHLGIAPICCINNAQVAAVIHLLAGRQRPDSDPRHPPLRPVVATRNSRQGPKFSALALKQAGRKPESGVFIVQNRTLGTAEGGAAMADRSHRFKVGQSVDLIPSTFRSAAKGHYEIVSLRPADGQTPQYRIKSRSESHERVVAESDLVPSE